MRVDPTAGFVVLLLLLGLFGLTIMLRRKAGTVKRVNTPKPNPAAPRAVCLQGPCQGKSFAFSGNVISFGREAGINQVVLEGQLVSRRHATVTLTSSGPLLQDLDSTNGTWVNGQRILQQIVPPGLPFQIGPYVFAVVIPGAQPGGIAPGQSVLVPPVQPPIQIQQPVSASIARELKIEQYDRIRLLGEGGAAYVFLARDRMSGNQVAIKVLKHGADPYFKQKFAGEGKIGMDLRHPHIVRTYSSGESEGVRYIIMEYLPGGSLRERMDGRALSMDQIINLIGQICVALHFAHTHDPAIYHRDIKPENILFDANHTAKLADFGIARMSGQRTLTREGVLIGTPEYMSFEQVRGIPITDGRSDQYSLAIVLYEIFAGRPPFIGTDALKIVDKHIHESPPPLSGLNPRVDGRIESVIMKALSKDRNRRYGNMMQMAKALGYRPSNSVAVNQSPEAAPAHAKARRRSQIVEVSTGRSIELDQSVIMLNREFARHDTVSRNHAQIRHLGEAYVIEDIGSSNGTFVNGQKITAATLTHGDMIQLGPVVQYQFVMQ